MKTLAIICTTLLIVTIVAIGCGGNNDASAQTDAATLKALLKEAGYERAEIYTHYETVVPDSMKLLMAKWITETVAAASSHMTGGDYEDPEDLVEEVSDQAKEIFGEKKEIVSLAYLPEDGSNGSREVIGVENMTPMQKKIFDFLNRQ